MPIRVVADSACDLPLALAAEHNITVVPLTLRFGEQEFVDQRDLTPTEFWARCAASPTLPETAQPSPGAFEEAFRAAAAGGADGVVSVDLSARLSGTVQSATIAADAVKDVIPVRVIDSRSASIGAGIVALAAARAAAAGGDIDAVCAAADDSAKRVRVYAALDTFENLKKGGRAGGAQALVGSLLSIKPVIEIRDGVVEKEATPRTRSKSLKHLLDKVREAGDVEHLSVVHGQAPDIEEFVDMLGAIYPRNDPRRRHRHGHRRPRRASPDRRRLRSSLGRLMDDAIPLVERDPTPPAGIPPVPRPPIRQWHAAGVLLLVLAAVTLATVVALTA